MASEWILLCFSFMKHTLRCVTQDVLSSPVSIALAGAVCRGGYRHKIATLAPDLTGGGGAYGPAYITVAVGNRIHQIKSSIHLCGSGDSGGRVGGWERWRLT